MAVVLVPQAASTTEAWVWVGVFGTGTAPPDATLRAESGSWPLPAARWQPLDVGGLLPASEVSAWAQRVRLAGLAPGVSLRIDCQIGPETATARVATLPERLPRAAEPPFTVLLGSCFAQFQDEEGAAGWAVGRLPTPFRPQVKILCGDQVYLDNPWNEVQPRDQRALAASLLGKYVKTWTQRSSQGGFATLLGEGATYFLPDDHEFWNNHPNWSPLVFLRTSRYLREWTAIARALYEAFQAGPGSRPGADQAWSVGCLDFRTVDTRLAREPGDTRFMTDAALADLRGWLADGPVDRPGVLVLGPPLFTAKAGRFASKFLDRSLANYAQYQPLVDAILASRRSLLVLAGDVHFGRVAEARLPGGGVLVEAISSPLALVDKSAGRDYHAAPDRFPLEPAHGQSLAVTTRQWEGWRDPEPGLWRDQFMTLGFTETEQAVRVRLTAWQVGTPPTHDPIPRGWRDVTLPRRNA